MFPWDDLALEAMDYAVDYCRDHHHEFVTPEMVLLGILGQSQFRSSLSACGGSVDDIRRVLLSYLASIEEADNEETDADDGDNQITVSAQLGAVLMAIADHLESSSAERASVPELVKYMMDLDESYAARALHAAIDVSPADFLAQLIHDYNESADRPAKETPADDNDSEEEIPASAEWRQHVTPVTGTAGRNPLVGRTRELERTIQVLCRKDKNNPLHVGHPGVGKTALVYGLAQMIADGNVPQRLSGAHIYRLDMGNLVAGTQFRGDMEKRLKSILEGAASEEGAIIYIDEIHTLVGAGATGESALDAANMLKPYLESGRLRFIGSTTYEDYSRYFERSRSLVRRFGQIDVPEPTVDEALEIVNGLRDGYERYHGVKYTDSALEYAVRASARHITDRHLPDKALDVIDEAGAWRETHPLAGEEMQTVDTDVMADVVARICKVESLTVREESTATLRDLKERISAQIYGQDEAVRMVTEAVQMAKAGLTDESKPMASLLFVGPTGVGKTEVARVLAAEMGVELIRFDMSEYTEKHTVAKLIGAPAGYVGYDDGGLLTDAIRRSPNCVLLLDEIEKAHPDIYNILLQVMDYARLTDNKGRHADFRNVVLIMTSNAGAQYAAQASVGFSSSVTAGDAMLRQVRKTFKPEFINRLSGTVVFSEMTEEMASLILDKKLRSLRTLLDRRNVTLELTDSARALLLRQGFTRQYGAREMDRVIASHLKPLLMREILFGRLTDGGTARVDTADRKTLNLDLS